MVDVLWWQWDASPMQGHRDRNWPLWAQTLVLVESWLWGLKTTLVIAYQPSGSKSIYSAVNNTNATLRHAETCNQHVQSFMSSWLPSSLSGNRMIWISYFLVILMKTFTQGELQNALRYRPHAKWTVPTVYRDARTSNFQGRYCSNWCNFFHCWNWMRQCIHPTPLRWSGWPQMFHPQFYVIICYWYKIPQYCPLLCKKATLQIQTVGPIFKMQS